jgi:hypothetical protein
MDAPNDKDQPHQPHSRELSTGVVIGVVLALACAVLVHTQVANDTTGLFAFPATLVTAVFVGAVLGLMFASIVVGGRGDDRATRAAREAVRRDHAGIEARSEASGGSRRRRADPALDR